MTRSSEFGLIERYFSPLSADGAFSLGDDAALLKVPAGKELVVTQDAIAAGVHFFADDSPESIAKKAVRVNLSDLASKGAVPATFSMALGLHPDWDEDWLGGFARGLTEDCSKYSLTICGGDTFTAPHGPIVSITAFGLIDKDCYTSRMGASAGDELFVSGPIGMGALGLLIRTGRFKAPDQATADTLLSRYLVPQPPLALAAIISEYASAAMDISDGFVGDLGKLAAASQVGFDIPLDLIPFPQFLDSCSSDAPEITTALTGGDDYQFVFTVPSAKVDDMLAAVSGLEIHLSRLVIANEHPGIVRILDSHGHQISLASKSWNHF